MLSYVYFIDGEVLEKYRSRLRELLVGVSQRLEMAVESRTYKYLNRCHHLEKYCLTLSGFLTWICILLRFKFTIDVFLFIRK